MGRSAVERSANEHTNNQNANGTGNPGWLPTDGGSSIRGPEAWDRVLRLVVDAAEAPGPGWVRTAGDPGAWDVSCLFFFFSNLFFLFLLHALAVFCFHFPFLSFFWPLGVYLVSYSTT